MNKFTRSILDVNLIIIEIFLFFDKIIEIEIIKFKISDNIPKIIINILSYPLKKFIKLN